MFIGDYHFRTVNLACGASVLQADLGEYWIDYLEGGPDLVLTFDSAGGPVERPDALRDSWGQAFLAARGFSILGIKPRRLDWYRGKTLHRFFKSSAFQLFAQRFERHIFYGTSMGGYGALAFAEAIPGALVIAHNPQTTLDERLVPWERRFVRGRTQDWSGDFADGASAARTASRIYMTYDPFHELDRRHVERVVGESVVRLKMPFLGHGTPEWLLKMQILKEVSDLAFQEKLTRENFARLARARRRLVRYYLGMYQYTKRQSIKKACLEYATNINSTDGELLFYRILNFFEQKNYLALVELYDKYPDLKGLPRTKSGEAAAIIALGLNRAGRLGDALRIASKSADLTSENVRELNFMSEFQTEIQEFQLGADFAAAALRISPKRADAYLALARAQIGLNQTKNALETLSRGQAICGKVGREYLELRGKLEASALHTRASSEQSTVRP